MITNNDTGKKTYLISIAGVGDFGYAYYVARLFAKMGKITMLIDNDVDHEMFRTMARNEDIDIAESENLICMPDITWSPEPFSHSEFIVAWHGMHVNKEIWERSDLRVLVCDFDKFHVEEVKKMIANVRKDVHLVIANKCTGKTAEKDILKRLEIEKDVYTSVGYQTVNMEVSNYASMQALKYNYKQRLKGFTNDYRDIVSDIAGYFLKSKTDKKLILKALATVD